MKQNSMKHSGSIHFLTIDRQSFLNLAPMKLSDLKKLEHRLLNEIKKRENKKTI